jgi:2-iminobutanoate/2-iminopropanoate deaminase
MTDTQPAGGPPPLGPYTPIVAAGPWFVCSGQVGQLDGRLVDGGVGPQAAQCVANLETLLQSQGLELSNVVKTTVFLTDIADYAEVNAAYVEAFKGHRPARSAVAVAGLPMGALVEIEAWAYAGE